MADLNLLPPEYGRPRREKRRRQYCLVLFFILLALLGSRYLSLLGRIQAYRRELADLEVKLARLAPELGLLAELDEIEEMIERRQTLREDLAGADLTWPLLLREIKAAAHRGIRVLELHLDGEGEVKVEGQARDLAEIASFLSALAGSPSLDNVDIAYVKLGKEGQWLFALQGWVKEGGAGL